MAGTRKKSARQQALDFVSQFLDDWQSRTPDRNAAFRDWAVEQVLWSEDLGWEAIKRVTAVDGPGDLGIDGWYLAKDDSGTATLFLFQSKNTKPEGADLSYLHDALERVYNPVTNRDANTELKLLAAELQDEFPESLRVEFHIVTSDIATDPLRHQAERVAEKALRVLGRDIPCEMFVHDVLDLQRSLEINPNREINETFAVSGALQHKAGGFNTVTFALNGVSLQRLYAAHGTNLFRLNPRYYLGARTTVNSGALTTLLGNDRDKFFLFNNGITAIATAATVSADGRKVSVRGLQIVNGCQTTATLHKAWLDRKRGGDSVLNGVDILVRVIESPSYAMAPLITENTNSQNPTKLEDFKANDRRQVALHDAFARMRPAWFYENKRGEWAVEPERARYTGRHMTMKDLSQACLAFLGDPSDATDRARIVFRTPKQYDRVFPESALAVQLLLPYQIFLYASELIKPQPTEMQYLRYPLASVVSRFIRDVLRTAVDTYPSPVDAQRLMDTLPEWGEDVFRPALSALSDEVSRRTQATTPGGTGIGTRALVRQKLWTEPAYTAFKAKIDELLAHDERTAKEIEKDPTSFGLRARFPYPLSRQPV
jgi:hypothetical protein